MSEKSGILLALDLLGTPYLWGGNHPTNDGGLDCSGYLLHVWRNGFGVNLRDNTAHGLYLSLDLVMKPEAGDAAFYSIGRSKKITHVMMVLNKHGSIPVIGASGGGRPSPGESKEEYRARMAKRHAEVKIYNNYDYRQTFRGFRRMPG